VVLEENSALVQIVVPQNAALDDAGCWMLDAGCNHSRTL